MNHILPIHVILVYVLYLAHVLIYFMLATTIVVGFITNDSRETTTPPLVSILYITISYFYTSRYLKLCI